jgi:hypothetical protein
MITGRILPGEPGNYLASPFFRGIPRGLGPRRRLAVCGCIDVDLRHDRLPGAGYDPDLAASGSAEFPELSALIRSWHDRPAKYLC